MIGLSVFVHVVRSFLIDDCNELRNRLHDSEAKRLV